MMILLALARLLPAIAGATGSPIRKQLLIFRHARIVSGLILSLMLHALVLFMLPLGVAWTAAAIMLCAVWMLATNTMIPAMQTLDPR